MSHPAGVLSSRTDHSTPRSAAAAGSLQVLSWVPYLLYVPSLPMQTLTGMGLARILLFSDDTSLVCKMQTHVPAGRGRGRGRGGGVSVGEVSWPRRECCSSETTHRWYRLTGLRDGGEEEAEESGWVRVGGLSWASHHQRLGIAGAEDADYVLAGEGGDGAP